jgi:hypothetical protein
MFSSRASRNKKVKVKKRWLDKRLNDFILQHSAQTAEYIRYNL